MMTIAPGFDSAKFTTVMEMNLVFPNRRAVTQIRYLYLETIFRLQPISLHIFGPNSLQIAGGTRFSASTIAAAMQKVACVFLGTLPIPEICLAMNSRSLVS